ncbi:MAG: HupE/UreJ family protein [Hyphomonadaceae bacterium]|nr:HupE/UreJ family protein [Hyphomonadaceae bacterium]
MDGFTGGFRHPFLGLDHMAAMVAVGLWGALLGAPALWALPLIFPLIMALGGVAGLAGVEVPGIERGIAGSAVVLGVVVALAMRAPLWFAGTMVGVFALFHGFAHGRELPAGADPAGFFSGFVIATGLLHLTGVGFGLISRWRVGDIAVRTVGGAIALIGAAFLLTAP